MRTSRLGPLLLALALATGSILTGCSGNPSCSSGEACVEASKSCVQTCSGADAGSCPTGTVCTVTSGCCSGTGCSAIQVNVCCPASGC